MTKKRLAVLAITWLVLLVAGSSVTATLAICGVLGGGRGVASSETYTVTAEEYEMLQRYRALEDVYQIMMTEYVEEPDERTLLDGAAQGMLASVEDPYTFYYTVEEMKEMNEAEEGNYEGVGMQISLTEIGLIRITRVFKDTPSMEAGIRSGDYLTHINGQPVQGVTSKDLSDAVQMIKDDEDGVVEMTMTRDGEPYTVSVKRRMCTVNRVEYTMLPDQIGYIMLYEFQGDAAEGFAEALEDLKSQGMEKLIVDLRSNPGGALNLVLRIADSLLPKGQILDIVDRYGNSSAYYSNEQCLGLPLAILVNGNSASASEVLTGAVQDHGVGVIVGEKTFGKGIVQSIYQFGDGSGLQLTIARYYTPSGRYIHGEGIEPDIVVEQDDSYDPGLSGPQPESDAQLKAAIDALMGQK